MIELTVLALLHRLATWGLAPVLAERPMPVAAGALREILADPGCQRHVTAPLGRLLRPRAHVGPGRSSRVVAVSVSLHGREALWLTWILVPARGMTEVTLAAQLDARGVLARVALALGGRRWLRGRLEAILATVGARAHRAAEQLDAGAERSAGCPGPAAAPPRRRARARPRRRRPSPRARG